jgi:multicomponent Na+:H+ antiporter subunit F
VIVHPFVFDLAVLWLAALLGVSVALVVRRGSVAERIVSLDTLVVVLVGLLAVFALERGESYYLDAALVLALVAFVATLAAARSYDEDRPL